MSKQSTKEMSREVSAGNVIAMVEADNSWSPSEKMFLKRLLENVPDEETRSTPRKRKPITLGKECTPEQEYFVNSPSAEVILKMSTHSHISSEK
jgi:hypothetical protein